MILGVEPIQLSSLRSGLRMLAELDGVYHARVPDAFSEPRTAQMIAEAVAAFTQWVGDNAEREPEIRRALAYVLNLPDAALVATSSRLMLPLPTRDAGDRRRFLTMLWDDAFASWHVRDFDTAELEVDLQEE